MLYAIYACESMYHGLHGIEDWCVCNCKDDDEANEIGYQMSYDLIESYGFLTEEYDEYDNCTYEDFMNERIEYEWFILPENIQYEEVCGLCWDDLCEYKI